MKELNKKELNEILTIMLDLRMLLEDLFKIWKQFFKIICEGCGFNRNLITNSLHDNKTLFFRSEMVDK